MKKISLSFLVLFLLIILLDKSQGQWDDLIEKPVDKKPLNFSSTFIVNNSDPIPTLLKSIDLIANSKGPLATPRFIYKGVIDGSEYNIKNPENFLSLIDSASLSSVSLNDEGQFYISQGSDQNIHMMISSINSVNYPEIELRFGADDEGLAMDIYNHPYKVVKVPFSAWDLHGTPNNPDDDMQLLTFVGSYVADDTTGNWGIRNEAVSQWTVNPAKESDWLYIYEFNEGKNYTDLEAAWDYQNVNGVPDSTLNNLLGGRLLRRVTVNSLDANPLTTINSLNGLARPKAGTIIRWTYEIGLSLHGGLILGVVGEEILFTPNYTGYPTPQIQFVSGPSGMYIDADTTIHWTPGINDTGRVEFTLSASNYRGTVEKVYTILVDPLPADYKNHNNNMKVSVFNNGLIGGYGVGYEGAIGEGISYIGKNGLYAAGIFIAASADSMAGGPYNNNDFLPLSMVTPIESSITGLDQAYTARFNDHRFNRETGVLGITITQNSFSSNQVPTNGFVILDYMIHNDNNDSLKNIYFSAFADFDIMDYSNNLAGYDASRKLTYEYHPAGGDSSYYYGMTLLKGDVSGFTDLAWTSGETLFNQLSEIAEPTVEIGDRNLLLASGPFDVAPNESFRVVYAMVAGTNLMELQNNTDYAHGVNLDYDASLVTFQVDMSVQEEVNDFSPDEGDMVILRGSFNDWLQGNDYRLDNQDGSSVYKLPVLINQPTNEVIAYKFLIVASDSTVKEWENPKSGIPPQYNRIYTLTGEPVTLPLVLFNNETARMADSLALVEIYNSMNGDNWSNKENWLSDQPIDSWFGVTVNGDRVTDLALRNNDLSGALSPVIGNLAALQFLSLTDNSITGEIPAQLFNLTSLTNLYLNDNNFEGELSEGIGKLNNLRVLSLYQNLFSGYLPAAISNLSHLEILDLQRNSFSGEWPTQLLNLLELTRLSLSYNNFSGEIPNEIGQLNKLISLIIDGNSFSGQVPGQINNLTFLSDLYLHNNKFDQLYSLESLLKLKNLLIHKNKFTFEDIEPNLGIAADTIIYAPQDSVGMAVDTLVDENTDFTLKVIVGGDHNQYQWFKGESEISGATGQLYTITVIAKKDQGFYHCRITNDLARDLTLYSRPVNVEVKSVPLIGSEGAANEIRATFCRISAHILPYGNEVTVKFQYGRTNTYGDEIHYGQNPISGMDGQDVFVELTGLQKGTQYHWRVVLEYADKVINGNDQAFTTMTLPNTITLNETINFPSHSSAADYQTGDYLLLGLPGNGENVKLADIMQGEFKTDWTAYWDNGNQNDYLVVYDDGNPFKLFQGRGYWALSKNPLNINISVPQAELNSRDAALIPLHQGWNVITNPFNVDIAWQDVKTESGISNVQEPLWTFDGTYHQDDRLRSFTGNYFFNGNNLSELKVPLKPIGTMKKNSGKNPSCFVVIGLNLNGEQADNISFAINDDLINYRIHKPRTIAGTNGIYYLRPEWDEKYPAFTTDVRKTGKQIYECPFEINIGSIQEASLKFSGIDYIDQSYAVYLVDIETASYQNLRDNKIYSFPSFRNRRSFKLFVGEMEIIEAEIEKILPREFVLEGNYPNPFNPETVIPLKVPEEASVELSIYNLLGSKVVTLFNGRLNAGRHLFKWNGRNSGDTLMPSGVYFYQVQTGDGIRFTCKMILLR